MSWMCRPNEQSRPFVAYLADPAAVGGAAVLMRQKRAVERLAADLGGHVARWGVDSGRRFHDQRCGDAVLRLIADLGRGDTVLVEDLSVLGADREAVEVVAGTMAMLGVAVLAARGAFAGMASPHADVCAPVSRAMSVRVRLADRARVLEVAS